MVFRYWLMLQKWSFGKINIAQLAIVMIIESWYCIDHSKSHNVFYQLLNDQRVSKGYQFGLQFGKNGKLAMYLSILVCSILYQYCYLSPFYIYGLQNIEKYEENQKNSWFCATKKTWLFSETKNKMNAKSGTTILFTLCNNIKHR